MVDFASIQARAKEMAPSVCHEGCQTEDAAAVTPCVMDLLITFI
jgi:hypothetical protein